MTSGSIGELVQAAGRAANAGHWNEAESLWYKVLEREPGHPQALCSLGVHALKRGDTDLGLERLKAARAVAPEDLYVLKTLIDVHRERGDPEAEREAIEAALAVDPYFVPALLARGNWLERFEGTARAASVYANALKISPPEQDWPAAYRAELVHARSIVDNNSRVLEAYLSEKLACLQRKLPPKLAERWAEAASIRAGRSKPYHSESNQLHVPRLPAIPFFDRAEFLFLKKLEKKTDIICHELQKLLDSGRAGFQPYIAYKPGEPVNQWKELDHSDRWSAYQLWQYGKPITENLERCPYTAKALADLPMAGISGVCPNALFSALAPKTHIPPHNGESNARLVAHLPLIIPPKCKLRVGFEEREWKLGEALVFDDTIEHEASNESDELRVVLIFDLWNPLLTETERKLVNAMAEATREFS